MNHEPRRRDRFDAFFLDAPPSDYDEGAWKSVCDDFLDPMVDDVAHWISRLPDEAATEGEVVSWLHDLTYILHAVATGIGSDGEVSRWNRAQAELTTNVSSDFVRDFASRARDVFERAHAVADEFLHAPSEFRNLVLQQFACEEVGDFRKYLHNCSLSIRPRLPSTALNSPDDPKAPPHLLDGPQNGVLIWKGRTVSLSTTHYRLIEKVWDCCDGKPGRASVKDVVFAVWGDEEKASTSLPSTLSRLNDLLSKEKVPVTLNKRGDFLELSF